MLIPLVDILRCTRPHAETWLIASIEQAAERDIKSGFLGCPTCLAEYQIRNGVVYFVEREPAAPFRPAVETTAMMLAAALDLVEPRMTALLHGAWAAHAPLVRATSPSELLLLDPPIGMISGDGLSILMSDLAPLAAASINAVAVDEGARDELLASMRRALKAGGRMLAPTAMPVPTGFTELARDASVWVARLDDATTISAPIPLARRPRTDRQ